MGILQLLGFKKRKTGTGSLGSITSAGDIISRETALEVTAVLCAVRILAESLAQLPLKLMVEQHSKEGATRSVARENKVHKLLSEQPNDNDTSYEWREIMMMHAVLTGTGFSYLTRNEKGEVLEILPIEPDKITVEVMPDFKRAYSWTVSKQPIERKNLFILKGFTNYDGVNGLNIIQSAREQLGLSSALTKNQSTLTQNGLKYPGILVSPTPLSDVARAKVIEAWKSAVDILKKGGAALLDNGLKFERMAQSPVDAQALENRGFQIAEVGRAFNVHPQFLMHSDKTSSFASAEMNSMSFVMYSLMPWVKRFEEAIKRDIVGYGNDLYPTFAVQGLMRSTAKERAEYYKTAILNGWMTPNEVRALEQMNRIDGLDETWKPLNYIAIDEVKPNAA
jgi:HK97 family phage portal protein